LNRPRKGLMGRGRAYLSECLLCPVRKTQLEIPIPSSRPTISPKAPNPPVSRYDRPGRMAGALEGLLRSRPIPIPALEVWPQRRLRDFSESRTIRIPADLGSGNGCLSEAKRPWSMLS
jgi:hypothetical protein